MSARSRMTKAKRVRVFDSAGGVCHICKFKIDAARGEQWHVEHVKPLWEGGADEENNMRPAHIDCHAVKSKAESKPRAKTTRQRAKYIGASRPAGEIKSRGFPKAARSHEGREPAPGKSEIARRYGL